MAQAQARDALADLQWHWGEAYLITGMGGQLAGPAPRRRADAHRRRPGRTAQLIIEDYTARPVAVPRGGTMTGWPMPLAPSAQAQAAELPPRSRATWSPCCRAGTTKPRFEAVSRDGGSPYCLISDDAREIWRELRSH